MLMNPENIPPLSGMVVSADGQAAIAGYKVDRRQLFFPNEKRGLSAHCLSLNLSIYRVWIDQRCVEYCPARKALQNGASVRSVVTHGLRLNRAAGSEGLHRMCRDLAYSASKADLDQISSNQMISDKIIRLSELLSSITVEQPLIWHRQAILSVALVLQGARA